MPKSQYHAHERLEEVFRNATAGAYQVGLASRVMTAADDDPNSGSGVVDGDEFEFERGANGYDLVDLGAAKFGAASSNAIVNSLAAVTWVASGAGLANISAVFVRRTSDNKVLYYKNITPVSLDPGDTLRLPQSTGITGTEV